MLLIKDSKPMIIELLEKLKPGGTKVAYKISNDQVLILPNRPNETWNEIVTNEVSASQFLTSIGLLNPYHEPVYIPSLKINSYLSKSFESFEKDGIKVIDVKHPDLVPLLTGDMYDMKTWEYVLEPLLADILIMHKYGIPYSGDSANLAYVNGQVRYFGFDFPRGILERKYNLSKYNQLIYQAVESIMFAELEKKFNRSVYVMPQEYEEFMLIILKSIK